MGCMSVRLLYASFFRASTVRDGWSAMYGKSSSIYLSPLSSRIQRMSSLLSVQLASFGFGIGLLSICFAISVIMGV